MLRVSKSSKFAIEVCEPTKKATSQAEPKILPFKISRAEPSQNQNSYETSRNNNNNFDFNDETSSSFLYVFLSCFVKKFFARFARFLSSKQIINSFLIIFLFIMMFFFN